MWTVIHTALNKIRQNMQTPWHHGKTQIIFFINTVTASILFLILMHLSSREVSMALQFGQEAKERRHRLQGARRLSIRRKNYSNYSKKQKKPSSK